MPFLNLRNIPKYSFIKQIDCLKKKKAAETAAARQSWEEIWGLFVYTFIKNQGKKKLSFLLQILQNCYKLHQKRRNYWI